MTPYPPFPPPPTPPPLNENTSILCVLFVWYKSERFSSFSKLLSPNFEVHQYSLNTSSSERSQMFNFSYWMSYNVLLWTLMHHFKLKMLMTSPINCIDCHTCLLINS